jgi:ornithine cyclodeaminase
MLLISGGLLRELVPVDVAIESVRQAFVDASRGHVDQPVRLVVGGGRGLAMLAADRRNDDMVLKAISVRPQNPWIGLPAVQALVVWFDGKTGVPEAVIDGTTLTSMRTGAASGVATACLASQDARTLAVFGAGGQAADQIRSVCAVRPIQEVRIVDLVAERARNLAERLAAELPAVQLSCPPSSEEALAGADVVCTVTTSARPLFDVSALSEHVHVNGIGAFTERMCELPPELLAEASVVAVDQREAALAEAGDVIQAIRSGHLESGKLVELGDLLARQPARRHGRTVFKSVGIGAQDWAVARAAVRQAAMLSDAVPNIQL